MKELFLELYKALEHVTPLRLDCGTLCQAACCKGDQDTGMYLFPGEETVLRTAGFLVISPTELLLDNGQAVLMATCPGECDRAFRPLSCRIFPLTPYLNSKGILEIKMDPRAKPFCPLARNISVGDLEPAFIDAVKEICQRLLDNEREREFLACLSDVLDDFEESDFLGIL